MRLWHIYREGQDTVHVEAEYRHVDDLGNLRLLIGGEERSLITPGGLGSYHTGEEVGYFTAGAWIGYTSELLS